MDVSWLTSSETCLAGYLDLVPRFFGMRLIKVTLIAFSCSFYMKIVEDRILTSEFDPQGGKYGKSDWVSTNEGRAYVQQDWSTYQLLNAIRAGSMLVGWIIKFMMELFELDFGRFSFNPLGTRTQNPPASSKPAMAMSSSYY